MRVYPTEMQQAFMPSEFASFLVFDLYLYFALVLKCSLKDNQMSLWSMVIHIYPCLAFRKLHSVLPSEMYLRDKYHMFLSEANPRPLDVTTLWH